jgi:ketosteroid isomerase-like protein
MPANREIVTSAFAAWMNGTGYVANIFADDMTWEIAGTSAAARRYASTRELVDEVLRPFGACFSTGDPFRPVKIRAVYDNEERGTVVVVWDGRGTTITRTVYEDTWVWRMTLRGGKVIDGTASSEGVAFDELWETITLTDSRAAYVVPAA